LGLLIAPRPYPPRANGGGTNVHTPFTAPGDLGYAIRMAVANISAVLDEAELRALDAYWRAANYLSVGQIRDWVWSGV